jgi:Mrp family chromosome partitioning ATPase
MLENIDTSSLDPGEVGKNGDATPPDIIATDQQIDTVVLTKRKAVKVSEKTADSDKIHENNSATLPATAATGLQVHTSSPTTQKPVRVNKQTAVKKRGKDTPAPLLSKTRIGEARKIRTQCGKLCSTLFLNRQTTTMSLGFTSAIDGEGKTFLARLTSVVMSMDMNIPVTLLECNWEHPCFNDIFSLEQGPGLAEWLRGECELEAIRQSLSSTLTIIRAGDEKHDAVGLLQQFRKKGVLDILKRADEVLIVDLPSILTTSYGSLAAGIVDSLVVVVRMGVTPDAYVAEASTYMKDLHVHGVILNQMKSRLPRWLAEIL